MQDLSVVSVARLNLIRRYWYTRFAASISRYKSSGMRLFNAHSFMSLQKTENAEF